jgi:HEAT repeat protein
MLTRIAAVLLCLFTLAAIPAGAAAAGGAGTGSGGGSTGTATGTGTGATGSADSATIERVRRTLLYGIDSQVTDALTALKNAWNPVFIPELVAILTDKRSAALQTAVLEIFRDQSVKDGEAPAQAVLDGWQQAQSALAVSAIRYLASIHSNGLAARLAPIADSPDNALAEAAIDGLGQVGDSASAALLIQKYGAADYPDARKPEIILAMGTLKDKSTVDTLMAIVKNTDEDQIRRLYAADALGKIGDPRALPVLRDMLAEPEALNRQYAASALAHFDLQEVFDGLIQGLRDEDAKVRESSAKALARTLSPAQAAVAMPILAYKAELDPVSQVRIASINALGEIGGNDAFQTLLSIYGSTDRPLDSRETALTVLTAHALSLSLTAIRKVVDDEWKAYDTHTLESTAKVLSTVKDAQLREFYVRFLDNADPVVRSYGARGIALNGMSDLKDRLLAMADKDPNPGTRQEAKLAAAKL